MAEAPRSNRPTPRTAAAIEAELRRRIRLELAQARETDGELDDAALAEIIARAVSTALGWHLEAPEHTRNATLSSRSWRPAGGPRAGGRPQEYQDRPPRRDFDDRPPPRRDFDDRPRREYDDRPPRREIDDRPSRGPRRDYDERPRRDFGSDETRPPARGGFKPRGGGFKPRRSGGGFSPRRPPRSR